MPTFKFKTATLKDKKFLLDLKNEKSARKNSKNDSKISKSSHEVWLLNFLKKRSNKLLITSYKKNLIGYVRYEEIFSKIYKVSINIKPKFRNMGFGKLMLIKSENKIKKGSILISEIKITNIKSIKSFNSAGYLHLSKNRNYLNLFKILNQNPIYQKKINKIISNIENTRKKNNLNWMNVLKLSFKSNPEETKKLFTRIYKSDKKINNLSKNLL